MRSLLVLAVSAGAARAEPPVVRVEPPSPGAIEPVPAPPALPAPGTRGTGAQGIDDVWASGIVIAPPAHADSAEWPRGMVMTPPDPKDDNVLELGSVRLADRGDYGRPPPRTWPGRLSRGLARGLRGLVDLMTPSTL